MLNTNAIEILKARYLLRGKEGELSESPDQLFRRVAAKIAEAEEKDRLRWEERYFQHMQKLEFLPNSPTLMNAGLPEGQLSACFVLPVGDSMDSIFESIKQTALIHQSGGGTGFNFSYLRPRGDHTGVGTGTASGPIAFMKVFDEATQQVKQGGRRRGANMGVLHCTHPDILNFVSSKEDLTQLSNFNISVGITDAFMHAVERKDEWTLINPRNGEKWGKIPALLLWETICRLAWKTGDPGLLFLDTINAKNPLPSLGRLEATNPCGELPLFPYESCNLGSINLSRMISRDTDGVPVVNWEKLAEVVGHSLRFLDNVISINRYLFPQIRQITQANRKVGLGVMGWAEMLIELGIPYASGAAVALAGKLMGFIKEKSYEASRLLAGERGVFPNWEFSTHFPDRRMRNASCNSVAPTGSISVIAGTSYSIEPLYGLAFKRVGILEGQEQREVNTSVRDLLKREGLWTPELKKVLQQDGGLAGSDGVPDSIRELLATAHEIPWEYHLAHQQAFQVHTDNAVAKTINLPEETPVTDIAKIYWKAWEMGLKGITVYRDASRADQVLQHCGNSELCQL